MKQQLLQEAWLLRRLTDGREYSAAVPTSVLTVLRDHKVIPDPYYKDNEDLVRPVLYEDFAYTCTFTVEPEILACDQVLLRFEGLDTVADLSLNGQFLGHADNMHRVWEFSAKALLDRKSVV